MSYAEDYGIDAYDPPEEEYPPEINFHRRVWWDKNGKKWQIKNMTNFHIQNCLKLLRATTDKWDYMEEDINRINNKIKEFERELESRQKIGGPKF